MRLGNLHLATFTFPHVLRQQPSRLMSDETVRLTGIVFLMYSSTCMMMPSVTQSGTVTRLGVCTCQPAARPARLTNCSHFLSLSGYFCLSTHLVCPISSDSSTVPHRSSSSNKLRTNSNVGGKYGTVLDCSSVGFHAIHQVRSSIVQTLVQYQVLTGR